MSATIVATQGGGSAAPALPDLAASRRSVAARSFSGSCTPTSPRAFHATPHGPIAVSKTWWCTDVAAVLMTATMWSADSYKSTRILIDLPRRRADIATPDGRAMVPPAK